jgi:hypothetical protein
MCLGMSAFMLWMSRTSGAFWLATDALDSVVYFGYWKVLFCGNLKLLLKIINFVTIFFQNALNALSL